MLGLTESDLPPGAVVCSEHFRRSDSTVTNDGIVKDSIPLQFCMICLESGHSKMYQMNQNDLEKAYTTMTGIAVSYVRDKIATLPRVCAECARRLVNCDRLRDKSLRAYRALLQILQSDKVLTSHNLKSINRVEKQLISNIEKHSFEPDHCDLYVKCDEEDSNVHMEEEYSSDIKGNNDMTRVKYDKTGATDFDVVHEEDSTIFSEEEYSSGEIENTDMKRVNYDDYEKDSTYSDVEYLSETDDSQSDVHAINNIKQDKLNYDNIKNAIVNDDVQVNNTNNDDVPNNCDPGLTENNVQVINEDQLDEVDDDIIMNPNISNDFLNDEDVVLMIIGSADEVKSLEDDNKNDIDDSVENGFGDNTNNNNNVLLKNKYENPLNRLKDENRSKNRVILRNVIFLQESLPVEQDFVPSIDEASDSLRVLRVYSNKRCKNMNNTQNSKPIEQNKEFVPTIDKTNSRQCLRVYSNKKCKDMNNAHNCRPIEQNKDMNNAHNCRPIEQNKDMNNAHNCRPIEQNKDMNNAHNCRPIEQNKDMNNAHNCRPIEQNKDMNNAHNCRPIEQNKDMNNAHNCRPIEQNKDMNNAHNCRPIEQNKDFVHRIDESNDNLQFLSNNKCKNKTIKIDKKITNNQNKVKIIEEWKENVKFNYNLPDIFRETQNRCNIRNKDQLSSKRKILKTSFRKPKTRKEPKPCVPKPKKRNSIEKLFTKTILTYEEQLADIQRRQHTELYKSYPYKCDICFKGRWSLFTYNRHMDRHTDKHGKWECAICGIHHKTRPRLGNHVKSHAERYRCKMCNFVTGFSSKLKPHAQWHSGLAFKCPHCDAEFSKKSSYFSHVRLKHPSDFACPLCGFSFVSEHGVKLHLVMVHRSEDVQNLSGPSCAQCNVRFASEAAYDTHMAVSPKHVSSGAPMRNDSNYKRNRPKGRAPHRPGPSLLCEVCGKSFLGASLLNQHMNTHTRVKPHYTCDFCNKSFSSLLRLGCHLYRHSGVPRRYPCGVCRKDFSSLSSRLRHMRIHNPTKRPWYTCDICNKSFTTRDAKVNHVTHVHDKVPWPKRHRPQRRGRKRERNEDYSDSQNASDAHDASVAGTHDANVAGTHDANVADTDVDEW